MSTEPQAHGRRDRRKERSKAMEASVEIAWLVANGAPFSDGSRVAKFLAALPEPPPTTEPPRVAELLVSWCIKKRYREALLDDLDEVFQRDLSKGMTVARVRLRYWGSALHSITPQLLALAKRIGIFGLIADYARRLLH